MPKNGCGDAGPKAHDQASRLASVRASDARSDGWIDAVVADLRTRRRTGLAGATVGRPAVVAVRGVGHPSLVAIRGASAPERSADLSNRTAQLAARRSPPHDRAVDSTARPISLRCGTTSCRAEGRTRHSGPVRASARTHRADTDTGASCAACVLPLPPPGGDQGARLGVFGVSACAVSAPTRRGLHPGKRSAHCDNADGRLSRMRSRGSAGSAQLPASAGATRRHDRLRGFSADNVVASTHIWTRSYTRPAACGSTSRPPYGGRRRPAERFGRSCERSDESCRSSLLPRA